MDTTKTELVKGEETPEDKPSEEKALKEELKEEKKSEEHEQMEEGDKSSQMGLEDSICHKCQLRVVFPCFLPPVEEIKSLHPDIVQVFPKLSRAPPRLCFLTFSTPEAAVKAMEELSSVPYKNLGHLDIHRKDDPNNFHAGRRRIEEQRKKWVLVQEIPFVESRENIINEFKHFGCTSAFRYIRDENKMLRKGSVKLTFNTVKDADAFIANKEHHFYKNISLKVDFFGQPEPSNRTMRRQRRNEKRMQAKLAQQGYLQTE